MRGPLGRQSRRRDRDAALVELRSDRDPAVAAVGRALTAAVKPAGPAEHQWVARIEDLRAELGRSDRVIRTPRSDWTGDSADAGDVNEAAVSRLALEASKPERWGRVLLNLNRELRPVRSLELGTCIGLSTAYQAAGLELGGGGGEVATLEGDPARTRLAVENLSRLGLASRVDARAGRFGDTLAPLLAEVDSLGFAFVDGNHNLRPTLNYFERIGARMSPPGVLLFDDIAWSEGMREAWARISADRRVSVAIDLHGLGLCMLSRPRAEPDGGRAPRRMAFHLHP